MPGLWNNIKTVLLLGLLSGLMLGFGLWLGGTSGLTVALIFALLLNFGSYYWSDKIVLGMYNAKEADEKKYSKLHSIVERVVEKEGIPKPGVYVIPTDNPNAFATGRNPDNGVIAVTEGLLEILEEDEIEAVIAHEAGHIKNRDTLVTTVASTLAAVITYIAFFARFAAIFGGGRNRGSGNLLGLIALTIITPIVATIIQLAISRSREYLADEASARNLGEYKPLASALKKLNEGVEKKPLESRNQSTASLFIVNPFSKNFFSKILSTHPPLEERIGHLESLDL